MTMNFNEILKEYIKIEPVRSLCPDPVEVHEQLYRTYGKYDRFDELMKRYCQKTGCVDKDGLIDITGSISVICEFQNDMIKKNLRHYLPIINCLNERIMTLALECRGRTK